MKNFMYFIVLTTFLIFGLKVFANNTYSAEYIQHLKNCSPYSDTYETSIPTGDENTPELRLKSKETISGWLNGKCIIKTEVYSYEMNSNIMQAKCSFTKEQINSIVNKISAIKSNSSTQDVQILAQEFISYMQNPQICTVKNLLEE